MFGQNYSYPKYAIILAASSLSLTACSADGSAKSESNITQTSEECSAGAALGVSEAGLKLTTLCIDIKDGGDIKSTQKFTVEVAQTQQEQNKGLMFRTELADDKGMIFPYKEPALLSFWMKNTVISLDIIFINEDGSIANIARDTIPYSVEPVAAINPVIAVLELRAGLTQELNIKKGDVIRW